LGRRHLAQALEDLGFTVQTMASVYGERLAQELDDERWLADAGQHGWVVLLKDDAIRPRRSRFCHPRFSAAFWGVGRAWSTVLK
jgi:hypothetical protein